MKQLLSGKLWRLPSVQDRFDNVGRKKREANDSTYVPNRKALAP